VLQALHDAASQVTPYLAVAAYAGQALLVLGCAGLAVWIFHGWGTGVLRFSGRLLIALGVFFLACQAIWMIVGIDATLVSGEPEVGRSFWRLALVYLPPGLVMRVVGALRPTH
jgi:uncharacterized YccA/Bax inhibitor family protein